MNCQLTVMASFNSPAVCSAVNLQESTAIWGCNYTATTEEVLPLLLLLSLLVVVVVGVSVWDALQLLLSPSQERIQFTIIIPKLKRQKWISIVGPDAVQ